MALKIKHNKKTSSLGRWSIGIYEGVTPFDLAEAKDVLNPVLTGQNVDTETNYVADLFMIGRNDRYYMFFEILNRNTNKGNIGLAESLDGKNWKYKKIVLDEKFHLSYPYVFEWENDVYMIPESHQDLSVRVYKAISFPDEWKCIGKILGGYHFVDPSIFRYYDKWWLFVSVRENDTLNLYYSSDLLSGWQPHPLNPIIMNNKHYARPAGRVISINNKLYRFAQDDVPSYGTQVFAFQITSLSEETYAEEIVAEKPIISFTGKGWNAAGMHHIDLHHLGEKWIALVDGKKSKQNFSIWTIFSKLF